MLKKNVTISAKTVNVKPTSTGKGKQHPSKATTSRRTRRRNVRNGRMGTVATGSGPTTGLGDPNYSRLDQSSGITDQAKQFIVQACDPCGETIHSLDSARVPDGALATSAAAHFRFVEVIRFPWQNASSIGLDGKLYSMLVLQTGHLRAMSIILGREKGGEFDDTVMNAFARTWASLPSATAAFYPEFVDVLDTNGDVVAVFTICDSTALRSITPPANNGVSSTIQAYRITSQGMKLDFNTPDLINQGVVVSNRYPIDKSDKVLATDVNIVGTQQYYEFRTSRITGAVNLNLNFTVNAGLPIFNGLFTALPSPVFSATVAMRNAANTWNCTLGQLLRYESNGTNGVDLVNTTNTNRLRVATFSIAIDATNTYNSVRLYELSTDNVGTVDLVYDETATLVAFPPITQPQMVQQNPKSELIALKEWNGIYLPGQIFEPVYNMTKSSEYRKTIFAGATTDLTYPGFGDFTVGVKDTVDHNYGISVINLQGLSYACQMVIKVFRTVEILPAPDSLLGAFATGTPLEQPEAIDIVKCFASTQPQGYPPDYNGLGTLAHMIIDVVEKLEPFKRTDRYLNTVVGQVAKQPLFVNAMALARVGAAHLTSKH